MTNNIMQGKTVFGCLVLIALTLSSKPSVSQVQQARIAEAIDNNVVVRIPRTHHPLAMAANDRGRVSGEAVLERMVLVLKPSEQQAAALSKLIDGLQDKQSSSYHNWLTPEQYGEQFGSTESDIAQISQWLQQQGFQVDRVARGRQWVEFSGNVAQVENAFHSEMHHYAVRGEEHIANAADISIPRALAPVVSGVLSLHNFYKRPTHGKAYQLRRDVTGNLSRGSEVVATPNGIGIKPRGELTTNSSTHFLTPGDYSRIYDTRRLLSVGVDGTDVSIAVVGRTDINLSDVQTFRQIFALPANDPVFIVNGPDPGVNGDEIESALDVEWAGAVAPKATIKFVTTRSTFSTDGVDLSISYIVDNVVAPIMTTSYGQCEAFLGTSENAFFNSVYRQAAAEGITAFVSSGDNGPAGCDRPVSYTPAQNGLNVNGLASTPYNVAVGGTQFNEAGLDANYWLDNNRSDLSSAVGYIPEAVWNESCDLKTDPNQCQGSGFYLLWAGSGGASSCTQSTVSGNQISCISGYAKPSWQAGRGVINDGARDIPDLSLAAAGGHDGYLVCLEGSCQTTIKNGHTVLESAVVIGGTSASAPSMAGIMALVEQKNGSYQGLANYSFYQLATAEKLAGCNSSNLIDPTTNSGCVFYDITAGSNKVPGQTGFHATSGYDKATGLGSVDAANLVKAWGTVHKLGSQTMFSMGANAVQHGSPLPVQVAVLPLLGGGSPSGDFTIVSASHTSIFGGTVSNGNFSGPINGLAGGHYAITAHYAGDAMFSSSNSSYVPVTVYPEPSVTQASGWEINLGGFIVPLFGPVNYGQPVAIEYKAQGKSGIGSATGKATIILDNSVNLGTFALNQGGSGWTPVDYLPSTGLLPGRHTFTVNYSGDKSFEPSQSKAVVVNVRKVLPGGFVSTTPATITVGTPVRLLLGVLGPGVLPPSGTINVYDNGRKIAGPLPLKYQGLFGPGVAQLSYTASGLGVGSHYLQLSYPGDNNYLSLSLQTFSNHGAYVNVNAATGAATRVRLTPSVNPVSIGGSVNYSFSVIPTNAKGPLPTGNVTLIGENGGQLSSPVTLNNGNGTISLNWNFARQNFVSAAYSGDSVYSASNSPVIVTTVLPGTPTVTLTGASSEVTAGTQTSLTVSTLGIPSNPNVSLPYGQVDFFDSVEGKSGQRKLGGGYLTRGNGGNPIITIPVVLPAGKNVIEAKYRGTQDWKPTTSNTITVIAK